MACAPITFSEHFNFRSDPMRKPFAAPELRTEASFDELTLGSPVSTIVAPPAPD